MYTLRIVFIERSLYVVVRSSSVVCLSSVCNVRAPYSSDSNFRQCFYAFLGRGTSFDFQAKFYRDHPRGTPPSGR